MILSVIPYLSKSEPFPPVDRTLRRFDGLLCAGADLSIERLIDAYSRGIFPWYIDGEPILWWSPDPRQLLFVDEFHVSRSLRRRLNNNPFEITCNAAFDQVIRACAEPRKDEEGAWLIAEMIEAYIELHRAGHAHSVEAWQEGRLVGGVYGVLIGRAFSAESMFYRVSDASKVALYHLCQRLKKMGAPFIDCQQITPHTTALGARAVPRKEFVAMLTVLVEQPPIEPFA